MLEVISVSEPPAATGPARPRLLCTLVHSGLSGAGQEVKQWSDLKTKEGYIRRMHFWRIRHHRTIISYDISYESPEHPCMEMELGFVDPPKDSPNNFPTDPLEALEMLLKWIDEEKVIPPSKGIPLPVRMARRCRNYHGKLNLN